MCLVDMMSEDDVAYSALLAQLLSDSSTTRNARVHSWIEHQYDFVLSEHSHLPFASSRPPSPSPSSSLGAHRACSIDRPDSPLLPRISSDRTSSPCPSYDALFFPTHSSPDNDFEEQERVRALRFIVQEMAHWKSNASQPHSHDKPLPVPPPSPASSLTNSTSSRALRSRSSSTRISRLPSFTSTLSSDQSTPQDIPPPLPVSVIVHGEYQHDLILRHDGVLHRRDDSSQDAQYLCPILDDKDSFQPSPTLSNFSCAYSRETSITSPYASSPASPTNIVFSPCAPENIALPASPVEEDQDSFRASAHERTPSSRSSQSLSSLTLSPPKTSVFPASPSSLEFPPANAGGCGALHPLSISKLAPHSQSRWSVATTASLAPSLTESGKRLSPKTPPKKDKSAKTPKKRTRFISLISRFSPGRNDPSPTTPSVQTGEAVDYDSVNDSDGEEKKPRKSLSKKSSLASLRASFTLSRASFSSQRPALSSPIEEIPPLPTSPTLASPLPESVASMEAVPPIPKPSLSRIPSRGNILTSSLPPVPQSASTIMTFQSASQLSISDTSPLSASDSRISLASPVTNLNGSRISLLPASGKRTSLASAAGVEPFVSTKLIPITQGVTRSKSIFRLTAKPKSIKMPISPGAKEMVAPSRLPITGNMLSSPTTGRSRMPHVPAKFNPPAKLATVIATQSRQAPVLASPGSTSPTSKLPTPPIRVSSKVPRPSALEKPPVQSPPSLPPSSRLPMPASGKGARVGTVKGFWKRQ